jgi:hypothetical protein
LNDEILIKRNAHVLCKEINVPAFDIEGHVVWGATAMMLSVEGCFETRLSSKFDFITNIFF